MRTINEQRTCLKYRPQDGKLAAVVLVVGTAALVSVVFVASSSLSSPLSSSSSFAANSFFSFLAPFYSISILRVLDRTHSDVACAGTGTRIIIVSYGDRRRARWEIRMRARRRVTDRLQLRGIPAKWEGNTGGRGKEKKGKKEGKETK